MANDRIGEKFGRYLVIDHCDFDKRRVLCRCDCGTEKYVFKNNLFTGKTYSCGCYAVEQIVKRSTKHGQTRTRLYQVWSNMRRRCYDKRNNRYQNYGGKGIRVCDEWLDFIKFKEWAEKTGYDSTAEYGKFTIERINVDGNYEPDNCCWKTIQEQNMNRTSCHYLYYNGESHPIAEWEKIKGYRKGLIDNRIRKGWTAERAITQPPRW